MAHERQAIREKVVALLIAATTDAGNNVFSNRTTSLPESKLPAIVVYSDTEDASVMSKEKRESKRFFTIVLEVSETLTTDEALENSLDDISKQVEDMFEANRTLDSLAEESVLERTIFDYITERTNKSSGSLKMFYTIEYKIALEP